MITIDIKHSDGDRWIHAYAENMKELIDEVIPSITPNYERTYELLKTTKRFKSNHKKAEKQEKESGWYYDC